MNGETIKPSENNTEHLPDPAKEDIEGTTHSKKTDKLDCYNLKLLFLESYH